MKILEGMDQLTAEVGTHFGHSDWHTVSQQQVDLFAEATCDLQWIHVDPQRAEQGPFGTTIAHGYLTLALIPALVAEVYRVDGASMGINYGADKVRFPSPVPVGAKVRAGVELLSVAAAEVGYRLTTRVTIEIQDTHKPACVAEIISVWVP